MEEENVTIAPETAAENTPKFGKFKDADVLMKAYEELEAEFTRRSQRLKALEKSKEREPSAETEESKPAPSSRGEAESGSEALFRAVMESGEVRERVLAECLQSLKGVPLMTNGTGVIAPPQKPKTFAEAGSLALGYLKNKK